MMARECIAWQQCRLCACLTGSLRLSWTVRGVGWGGVGSGQDFSNVAGWTG